MNRRVWLIALYVSFVLAFLGIVVFIAGIVLEYFDARAGQVRPSASPFLLVALGGLCFAAVMVLLVFTIVGLLLARQTRTQGSGYGDAYRLIESFKFRDAIPLLERSIREGKETAEVLMLLTSAYAYSGQLARAQATADRAVELFPDNPDAYITLANGYRLQAAYDAAARVLNQAAALAPDQPIIWAELGFTQQFAGEHDAAFASFERAEQYPMPAMYAVRVFYHLANGYHRAGDPQNAARAAARMMHAREGLTPWKDSLRAMEGTAYGQALRYEIAAIERAIADADAGNIAVANG